LNLGDTDHAEKEAVKAISLNERLPEPHDLMSRVYEKKGNIKAALDECERAYQLSVQRDKLSFMTPEGRKLSDRLVNLRAQNIRLK
jgi:Tfp pilus assembly protein PilF